MQPEALKLLVDIRDAAFDINAVTRKLPELEKEVLKLIP